MKNVLVACRIVLGLLFVFAGVSGFFLINAPPPAPPGLAGEFQSVFFASRWVLFVDAIECIAGALLLANRFVPLGLTLLGAVLYNILAFHITIMPAGLPIALAVTLIWVALAWQYRAAFAPLLTARDYPLVQRNSVVTSMQNPGNAARVRDIGARTSRDPVAS
jgi:putative oxidoreductase